ncbi:MAG: hypothetical protein JXX28_09790 [Deltaproteobacteria bacterium]|nr:hypothetical protein [Deltaproteobacteria bacterium]
MLSVALLLWSSLASAARLQVVVEEDASPELLAERLGVDATRIEVIPFQSLRGLPAGFLGEGAIYACQGPSTGVQELTERLDRVEGDMAYMEFEQARSGLRQLVEGLRCLSEAVDPVLAHRIYYLTGLIDLFDGEEREARTDFRLALSFRPDAPWDDDFPPDGIELYERAREDVSAASSVQLRLAPGRNSVLLDGRPALSPLVVNAGPHLLQLGGVSYEVRVPPVDEVVLVSPTLYEPGALVNITEAGRRDGLAPLLELGLDPLSRAWVVRGDEVWERTDPLTWVAYQPLTEAPLPVPSAGRGTPLLSALTLVSAGAAAASWAAVLQERGAQPGARTQAVGLTGLASAGAVAVVVQRRREAR